MDIRKLQRAIVDGLEDVKAQNIAVFNTEHLSPMFERVIVASGTSNRQTKALASSVVQTVKARGMQVLRTEGEDNGEWIIVDCGAAVVHLMQPSIRDYYHLEELWGGKNVSMKLGAVTKLVKAEEPAKKTAAKKAAAKPVAARKAVPYKDPAAKKAPAKKAVVRTSTRTVAATPAAKTAAKPSVKPSIKSASKPAPKPAVKRAAPAKKASVALKPAAKKAAPRKATRS